MPKAQQQCVVWHLPVAQRNSVPAHVLQKPVIMDPNKGRHWEVEMKVSTLVS